jgi:hypothetical protein
LANPYVARGADQEERVGATELKPPHKQAGQFLDSHFNRVLE